jgi:proline dehydrogenase
MLPLVPRRLVRRFSAPYIAGDTLDAAITTVQRLASMGTSTTLDVLGEAISSIEEAQLTRDEYLDAIDALAKLGTTNLVNVSVKLTALGLGIDDARCVEFVGDIARRAAQYGGFVRIDMEDSPFTDATLAVHQQLVNAGHTNVGVVIQAYLHRSEADVRKLAARGTRVRMVKGIYVEPETIAWRDMARINRSFIELSALLLDAGCHVAFATHDDHLIAAAEQLIAERELGADHYEFQMLLGVREDRRDALVAAGHPVRVYVPFGARWYEYSMRRLRENPRVAGMVARDTLGSLLPGRRR